MCFLASQGSAETRLALNDCVTLDLDGASSGRGTSRVEMELAGQMKGVVPAVASFAADKPTLGFAAVILAAGVSPRRGRASQLSPYLGRTLVEHVARTALASGACEVVVVAGEHADEIRRQLRRLPVRVVENREWHEGIASSIRAGISRLRTDPAAAIVCLCDQPKVTQEHLRELGEWATSGGPEIVSSSYDGILGAPAAFARSVFPQLLELRGNAGARHLIRSAGAHVESILFEDANVEPEAEQPSEPPRQGRSKCVLTRRVDRSREPRAPPEARRVLIAV